MTNSLAAYDAIAVSFAYFAALWLRFDLRFSMIQEPYLDMWARFAPYYAVFCVLIFYACLVLGDNIFFGPAFSQKMKEAAEGAQNGAAIFGYHVVDPRPFGVIEFDEDRRAVSIEEKPAQPRSQYIVPGLYFYNSDVVRIASKVEPSARGELEITSVNQAYLEQGKLQVVALGEEYSWFDAGTADSLYEAAGGIRQAQEHGKLIGCPEEIAMENGWIGLGEVRIRMEQMAHSKYGEYLGALIESLTENRAEDTVAL